MQTYQRTVLEHLSFVGKPVRNGRHKIHPYPAMLHPLLVGYVINHYASKGDVIFDPFCGSGVTLYESAIRGYHAIGLDINPLALLISKTKTNRYNINELAREFTMLKTSILGTHTADIPPIKNVDHWYTPEVVVDLGKIRHAFKKEYRYKDFFLICFAYTCRHQSLTRTGEFKRYRVQVGKEQGNKVYEVFFNHIQKMIDIITSSSCHMVKPSIHLANSEHTINPKLTYDLVITSPPYGDSRTTVAYGQFSSFGAEWTNDLNPFGTVTYTIDTEGLGKPAKIVLCLKDHPVLAHTVANIRMANAERADEVLHFFNGYYKAIRNTTDNLNANGRVCFVVGNRCVSGYQIPMDQITASFLNSFGLRFEKNLVRRISNKVMPSKNSPTNTVGVTARTMTKEYILIFSKQP